MKLSEKIEECNSFLEEMNYSDPTNLSKARHIRSLLGSMESLPILLNLWTTVEKLRQDKLLFMSESIRDLQCDIEKALPAEIRELIHVTKG